MPARPGFLVKNAIDVGTDLDVAEPDSLDFNLLGNQRYGVISGCDISVTGSSMVVNIAQGLYVVNGQVVAGGGQVTLMGAAAALRFDLVVGDGAGHISAITGVADPNPIFPQYDATVCVLAAVLVKPGSSVIATVDVTDKRVFVPQRFVTAVSTDPVLRNSDPTTMATLFDVDQNGKLTWNSDTTLQRSAAGQLTIGSKLVVTDTVTIQNDLVITDDLTVGDDLVASNFRQGAGNPSGLTGVVLGDIYKNLTDGSIWAYQTPGVWNQLSTVPIPAGMTMTSFLNAAPPGWLLVNGQTVSKATAGGLWDAFPSWQVDPNNLRLPDARNCFFAWGTPGVKAGNPTTQVTIATTNLPPHHHLVSPTALAGGSHTHSASEDTQGSHAHATGAGGSHIHDINDPGHSHPPQPSGGGPNQYMVRVFSGPAGYQLGNQPQVQQDYTGVSDTNLAVTSGSSLHAHSTDTQGAHTHNITVGSGGASHTHPITENDVGNGTALDVTPPYMGMYLYIKT